MIDVDRGRVELDLGDDGPKITLWYPPGALAALGKALELGLPITRLHELHERHLTEVTLARFIWAGSLWANRKQAIEPIEERIWNARRSLADILSDVRSAIFYGIEGKTVDQAVEEAKARRATGPQQPAAEASGPGTMPSAPPSES